MNSSQVNPTRNSSQINPQMHILNLIFLQEVRKNGHKPLKVSDLEYMAMFAILDAEITDEVFEERKKEFKEALDNIIDCAQKTKYSESKTDILKTFKVDMDSRSNRVRIQTVINSSEGFSASGLMSGYHCRKDSIVINHFKNFDLPTLFVSVGVTRLQIAFVILFFPIFVAAVAVLPCDIVYGFH